MNGSPPSTPWRRGIHTIRLRFTARKRTMTSGRCIGITAKTSPNDRINGLQQGAVDYISKPFNIDELIFKIDSIINLQISKEKLIKSELGKRIVDTIMIDSGKNKDKVYFENQCRDLNITNREKEIILYIFQGKEDKEISSELNISYHTIRKHIRNIYEKCSVQNKIELLNVLKII